MLIKGVYKIPSSRHVFFIAASPKPLNSNLSNEQNKERIQWIVDILSKSKDSKTPIRSHKWKVRLIYEDDFFVAMQLLQKDEMSVTKQTYRPDSLKFLAMNMIESQNSDGNTLKVLSIIPDEDIIEIFI